MESTPSAEDRLSALEQRVAELETAAAESSASQEPGAAQQKADRTSSISAESPAPSGTPESSVPPDARNTALPGDAETFWALHGLVDHLGEEGGVTYTGYTTPRAAAVPWRGRWV
ncbi:hypothetical protein [Brevibacterium siliguriense]|uniref:hypothetical protein n=1 Tax=Brevibacterium siliguriense TaxID=1136497 RepID=UPI000A6DE48A|nr:hypothetical protein [Brevibacterium siliguriense]